MADRMDWFPFHAQDFLTSRTVLLMSDENVGRYVKLLAESWVHGPLPKDMGKMGRLIRLSADEMEAAWREIGEAFEEADDGYVNPRLEETRQEQEAKRERYVRAGRKGAQTRWSQGDNSNASSDANGNANATPNSSKKENKKEIEKKASPKKKARQLSDDWQPNDLHRQLAKREGVDCDREAANFRDHAEANARTQVDWDAAFRTWLRKANDFGSSKAPSKPNHHGGPYVPGAYGNA